MARIFLGKERQKALFLELKKRSNLTSDDLGRVVGISGRSFRGWMRGDTLPTISGVMRLCSSYAIDVPPDYEVREEYWSGRINGRKAALAYVKKYGPPGTLASRSKGGRTTQLRINQNPEYYRAMGCKVANSFKTPSKTPELAEFIGIVLGDGCLTSNQCQISLDQVKDEAYSLYVKAMIMSLFRYEPTILVQDYKHARVVLVNGVKFITLLEKFGLKIGNKMVNQVNIPGWIKQNKLFYTACVRGLYDTDGGTYTHEHVTNGYRYVNFGITFTSGSLRLLDDFRDFLRKSGIRYGGSGMSAMVYNKPGIRRFFSLVDPKNQKHIDRYMRYMPA